METERTAIRLEVLKLACSKVNTPEGIIALAKVLENFVIESNPPRQQKNKKSDNAESPKVPD